MRTSTQSAEIGEDKINNIIALGVKVGVGKERLLVYWVKMLSEMENISGLGGVTVGDLRGLI